MAEHPDGSESASRDATDDPVAHLRALGYVDPQEEARRRAVRDARLAEGLHAGAAMLQTRQFVAALDLARHLAAEDPAAIAPRRLEAEALCQLGRSAEALETLRALEHRGVERGDVAVLRCQVEAALRHWTAALEWADYAGLLEAADAPRAALVAADVHRRRQAFEAADRAYQAVLDQRPRWAAAWEGRGALALAQGRPETAVGLLLEALEIDFQRASAHAWLGRALMRLARWQEAHAALAMAQRLAPRRRGPARWLAQIASRRSAG
jgi:tetratricopeptide (TPR) repeat protein